MPDRHGRTIDDLTDVGDTRRYSEAAAPSDPDHAGAHQAILDIADRLGAGAARMLVDAADLLTNEPADGMPPVLAERCAACNHRRFAHRPPGGWYRPGPCQHVADQQPERPQPIDMSAPLRVDMCDCPGFVAPDPGPRFDSVAARLDRIEDRLARLLPGMDDHVDHHPGLHSTRARFDRVDEGTARVLADVDQLRDQLARIGDSLAAHYHHAGHDQAAAILQALRRPELGRDAEQVIYQVLTTTSGLSEPAIGEHRATRLAERIAHALYGESTELAPVATGYHPPGHVNVAGVDEPGPRWISTVAGHVSEACPYCTPRIRWPDPDVGGHVDLVEPDGLPSGTRVTHPQFGAGTVQGIAAMHDGARCLVLWDVDPGTGATGWVLSSLLTVDAEQTCSRLAEGTDQRCGADAKVVTRLGWRCPDHAPEQPTAGVRIPAGHVAVIPHDGGKPEFLPLEVAETDSDTGVARIVPGTIEERPDGPDLGEPYPYPEPPAVAVVGRLCAWPADGHIPSSIHVDTGARCRLPAHHRAVSPDDQPVTYSLPVCGDHLALARELDDWWIERLGTLEPAAAVINADGQDVQVFDDPTDAGLGLPCGARLGQGCNVTGNIHRCAAHPDAHPDGCHECGCGTRWDDDGRPRS